MKRIILITAGLIFLLSSLSFAGEPTNQLKANIDNILKVLSNKALKSDAKKVERRNQLRKVVNERFDFAEMAQRSLAANWVKRTPKEKKEFVKIFSDLLEKSYIDKVESYQDEKINYTSESIDGNYAVVKTKIVTKNNEIPIDYKMLKNAKGWMVYDVVIENVSLVNNYRSQFNKIISASSYNNLVKKMKAKLEGDESSGITEPVKTKGKSKKK